MGIITLLIINSIVAAVLIYLARSIGKRASAIIASTTSLVNLIVAVYALALNRKLMSFALEERYPWFGEISLHFGLDSLSFLLVLLAALLVFVVSIASYAQIKHRVAEFYALLMVFEAGIVGTFTSLNLILFYVFWEAVLLPMFFMIGVWGPRREAAKLAAYKFLVYTHVGGLFMFTGIIVSGLLTGTFDMLELAEKARNLSPPVQAEIFALIFFGLAFKLPITPFHTWLPDAHAEAPSPVSVLLAGLLLKMAGYGFMRFLWLFPYGLSGAVNILLPLSVFSTIYPALVAIRQDDIKRTIAYTSISHMSYIFLAVLTASSAFMNPLSTNVAETALAGAAVEMVAHGLIIGSLFLLSGVIIENIGTRSISKMGGLAGRMPLTAAIFTIGAMAAGGLPGTLGFVGEFNVFLGAFGILMNNYPYVLVSIAAPLIVIAYFLWVIQRMFHGKLTSSLSNVSENALELLPVILLLALVLLFGLFPKPLYALADAGARLTLEALLGGGR